MQDRETQEGSSEVSTRRMKDDWNSRALENAKWYINTVGVKQTDEEFFSSGLEELNKWWLPDFRRAFPDRDLRALRVFEMGCGIGRMTSHLADVFGEIWAVDVSGEMIAQAKTRFGHLKNVRWVETEGVSLAELPDEYFDLGFSIYVYQHMPSKQAIAHNISAAHRKLRPGGLYKFHTNGTENSEYEALDKNTWVGAAFPEKDIRELSVSLGAQLRSIQGSGTQYCWATLRRPNQPGPRSSASPAITIRDARRAGSVEIGAIPIEGDEARISLLVNGADHDYADCNNLALTIGSVHAQPDYVGPVVAGSSDLFPADLLLIEARVPAGVCPGTSSVTINTEGVSSLPYEIELVAGEGARPKIVTIRNGTDFGTDVYNEGPKSLLNLYVEGLDESASQSNVALEIDGTILTPDFVGYVSENGTWQVNAQLPKGTPVGNSSLVLRFDRRLSDAVAIQIRPGVSPEKV
jgi:SAM-dependent methyltransferase